MATAIDRNVWQYLADATGGAYDPALDASDVREERVAALRIVLHTPSILCVTPSVHAEFERIGDPGRWRENAGMRDVFIRVVRPCDLNSRLVKTRTRVLQAHHADPDDCRVVAEAEAEACLVRLRMGKTLRDTGQPANTNGNRTTCY